jgi:hypothetical protein
MVYRQLYETEDIDQQFHLNLPASSQTSIAVTAYLKLKVDGNEK